MEGATLDRERSRSPERRAGKVGEGDARLVAAARRDHSPGGAAHRGSGLGRVYALSCSAPACAAGAGEQADAPPAPYRPAPSPPPPAAVETSQEAEGRIARPLTPARSPPPSPRARDSSPAPAPRASSASAAASGPPTSAPAVPASPGRATAGAVGVMRKAGDGGGVTMVGETRVGSRGAPRARAVAAGAVRVARARAAARHT